MSNNAKHPKGLPFLFLTEMWERFGFYLMLGIFFLYMTDTQKGGMEMTKTHASDIFGTFIALVYLTPFIGGLLADRVIGYRASVTIGGILMGLGYMGLALPGMTFFNISLGLIILGNGFFKPNISTLLGNLYSEEKYSANKDAGYNIFYMGINIGALICNFIAAYLRNTYGWGYAFGAAGVGMFVGLIIFWFGDKHYRAADVRKPARDGEMSVGKILGITMVPAFLFGALAWFVIPGNIFGSDTTDAFIFGSLPIVIYYIYLWFSASREEKQPIAALLAIMAVVIVFWAIFKQNGTALTAWAENFTDREIPEAIVKPARAMGMVQEISPKLDSVPAYDHLFRAPVGDDGKVVKKIGVHPYLNNLPETEWPGKEGESLPLFSTELFQSVNPFFVVALTPLVVGFFAFLRRRKKEPSTPAKVGWGLVITSLSTLVMVGAVYAGQNGLEKSSALWLIGAYAVITVGELFLSPMGLSLVSKLSPPRITALMMGGWFLSTAIGNKLSGVLASMWDRYDEKQYFFLVNCVIVLCAAAAIFMMLPWLRGIINRHTGRN